MPTKGFMHHVSMAMFTDTGDPHINLNNLLKWQLIWITGLNVKITLSVTINQD